MVDIGWGMQIFGSKNLGLPFGELRSLIHGGFAAFAVWSACGLVWLESFK